MFILNLIFSSSDFTSTPVFSLLFTPSSGSEKEGLSLSEIITHLAGFFPACNASKKGLWSIVFDQKKNVQFYPYILAVIRCDTNLSDEFVLSPHYAGTWLLKQGYFCMNTARLPPTALYVFFFYLLSVLILLLDGIPKLLLVSSYVE